MAKQSAAMILADKIARLFNSYGAPLVFPGFDAREDRT